MSFNDDDDFELNYDELNEESRMTIAEESMFKILESVEKTLQKAKDNLTYCERSEFIANFAVISRYVGAIVDIQRLSDPSYLEMLGGGKSLTEEQIIEKIEEIELTAKEMSFTDLKEYESKKNKVQTDPNAQSEKSDDDPGF